MKVCVYCGCELPEGKEYRCNPCRAKIARDIHNFGKTDVVKKFKNPKPKRGNRKSSSVRLMAKYAKIPLRNERLASDNK